MKVPSHIHVRKRFPLASIQKNARVTELVYVVDLKSAAVRHVGSTPSPGTKLDIINLFLAEVAKMVTALV